MPVFSLRSTHGVETVVFRVRRIAKECSAVSSMRGIRNRELVLPTLSTELVVAIRLRKPVRWTNKCRLAIHRDCALLLAGRSGALVDLGRTEVACRRPKWSIRVGGGVVELVVANELGQVVFRKHWKDPFDVVNEVVDRADDRWHPDDSLESIVPGQMVDTVDLAFSKRLASPILDEVAVGDGKECEGSEGPTLRDVDVGFDQGLLVGLD